MDGPSHVEFTDRVQRRAFRYRVLKLDLRMLHSHSYGKNFLMIPSFRAAKERLKNLHGALSPPRTKGSM